MQWLRRFWDAPTAITLGVVAGIYLPAPTLSTIASDLITFFGIQSAIILPATLVTAGTLRADGLTRAEASSYARALRKQMTFWIVLLIVDFFAVGLLIVGKALNWNICIAGLNSTPALVGAIVFLTSLGVFRTASIVRGVFSLQTINAELTLKAIEARNRLELQTKGMAPAPLTPPKSADLQVTPPGFGKVVKRRKQSR